MPAMTPHTFFEAFVLENWSSWNERRSSICRACNLAVSAASLADHYYRYYHYGDKKSKPPKRDPGLSAFQRSLVQRYPEFADIQAIANAYKHLYTWEEWSVGSPGALESVAMRDYEIEADYAEAGDVSVRHRDGRVSLFSLSIDVVMEMWREKLHQPEPTFT